MGPVSSDRNDGISSKCGIRRSDVRYHRLIDAVVGPEATVPRAWAKGGMICEITWKNLAIRASVTKVKIPL